MSQTNPVNSMGSSGGSPYIDRPKLSLFLVISDHAVQEIG